eukprot:jgi/Tetstr1/428862/TSEL_018848.t1
MKHRQAARRVVDEAGLFEPARQAPRAAWDEAGEPKSSPAWPGKEEEGAGAMNLDEVDADVEVVCRPQKRSKDSNMLSAEEPEGAEGVFHTRSMTVTCHCSTCKGGREFTPSQFEVHGGLGCNKRWRTSIFVKQSDEDAREGARPVAIGAWLKGLSLDSDFRRSLQRQERDKLMPPGWSAEYSDQKQGKKPCFLFKGTCETCGKIRSVDRREHMDKFLSKHRHNPHWAGLTVDSFPWNMRNTILDKAAAANTEMPAKHSMDTGRDSPKDEAKPGRDPRYSASTSRGFDADDADDGGGSDDMEPGEARGGVRYRPSELDGDEMNDASQAADVMWRYIAQALPPHCGSPVDGELRCRQCGTTQSPQWRNGRTMCNACYLRSRKDKLALGKRRSTAPAGIKFAVDGDGMPYGAPLQRRPTPTGLPWPLGHLANSAGLSPGRPGLSALGGAPGAGGSGGFHNPSAMPPAPGHSSLASQLAQRHKFRRTDNFLASMYPHPMAGLLSGGPPAAVSGRGPSPRSIEDFLQHQAAAAAARERLASGSNTSPHGPGAPGPERGPRLPLEREHPSSPPRKPTFSAEESVLRQIAAMDAGVAESLGQCAAAFAEARCNARDQGYEEGKQVWKSRVSQMLAEGSLPMEEELRMPAELAEAVGEEQERRLEQSLRNFCAGVMQRWRAAQVHSVEAAHHEGQRMAREDVKKRMFEIMKGE